MNRKIALWLVMILIFGILVSACSSTQKTSGQAKVTNKKSSSTQTKPTKIPALKDVLGKDFLIGAAVLPDELTGKKGELLSTQFNSLVAGNAMKPESLEPEPGVFTWDNADAIVKFAKAHNMKVRFHTLVWYQQTPEWFFEDAQGNELVPSPANKKLVLDRLKKYITAVLSRYKGDIESVDVVNEVIDETQPDGFRRSKWYDLTGTDYIKTAFVTARQVVGPNVKLYINDYNTADPVKDEFLYKLVKSLLDEGVPIDGVGHQMHINLDWPSTQAVSDSLDKFAALGLDNKITEMDVSVYTNSTDTSPVTKAQLIKQGYRYKEFFDLFRKKKDEISQVITWGIADDNTWLSSFPITRDDQPLLFGKQLQPKYAFWGIVDPSKLPPMP